MSTSAAPRPVGEPVEFTVPPRPQAREHRGRLVTLRPLDPRIDAQALYPLAHGSAVNESTWDYLPDGPFATPGAYREHLEKCAASSDPLFFAVTAAGDAPGVPAGTPLGTLSLLSIVPEHGRIEIGHIWFSPQLQRTAAATEAIFLLASHAMDELGYRRLEWKCNALNAPSRSAALRYGFLYEGTFLKHQIVKGRNRDTAWFAITDDRWPALREAFKTWLGPENFEANGAQKQSLRDLTAGL